MNTREHIDGLRAHSRSWVLAGYYCSNITRKKTKKKKKKTKKKKKMMMMMMMSLRMWYLCTDAAHMRTDLSLPLSFIFLRVSPPFFPFSSCVISLFVYE